MKIGLRFRERLTGLLQVVQEELDQLMAAISGTWDVQHDPEGGHSAITATDLIVTNARYPTFQSQTRGHLIIVDDVVQGRPTLDFTDATFSRIDSFGTGGGYDGRVRARIASENGGAGSTLKLGTSNIYRNGITNTALALGPDGFMTLATQPRCQAFHNTAVSVVNATWTSLSLNSEDHDTANMHSTTTNTSRLTIPTRGEGIYLLGGNVTFVSNVNGDRRARLLVNGTTVIGCGDIVGANASDSTGVHAFSLSSLAAGSYVEVQGYQTSGGALDSGSVTREFSNALFAIKLA